MQLISVALKASPVTNVDSKTSKYRSYTKNEPPILITKNTDAFKTSKTTRTADPHNLIQVVFENKAANFDLFVDGPKAQNELDEGLTNDIFIFWFKDCSYGVH